MTTISLLASAGLSALLAGAIVAFAAAIGYALLPAAVRPRADLAVPLGLSAGTLVLGLVTWTWGALVGTATLPLPWIVLGAACFRRCGLRTWLRSCRCPARRLSLLARSSPLVSTGILVALLPVGLSLLTPLADSDGLRYHAALPKLWLMEGRISWYPWDVLAGLPQAAEMLFLPGIAAGLPETAKFLHAAFFLAAGATLALAVHGGRRTRAAAPLAFLFVAASPVLAACAGSAFVDAFGAFHVAAALALLVRRGGARLAPVPLAAALATKVTTAPAVGALLLVAASFAPRGRRLRALAFGAGIVALAFLPFGLRNVLRTGDPLFPAGYGLLAIPVPGVLKGGVEWATRFGGAPGRLLHLEFFPGGSAARPDEVLGPHVLALLLLAGLGLRERRLRPLAAPVVALLPLWLFLAPSARFFVPALLGLAGLGAAVVSRVLPRGASVGGLLLAAPGVVATGAFLVSAQHPLDVVSGRLDREAWLSREVPGYRAARSVPAAGPGRVMALDFPAPFYLPRPWVAEGVVNTPPLKQWLSAGCGADELLERTRGLGVRFLLVTPGYGGGSPLSLLALTTPSDRRGVESLLAFRSRLRLVSTVDGVDLWEVPSAAPLP